MSALQRTQTRSARVRALVRRLLVEQQPDGALQLATRLLLMTSGLTAATTALPRQKGGKKDSQPLPDMDITCDLPKFTPEPYHPADVICLVETLCTLGQAPRALQVLSQVHLPRDNSAAAAAVAATAGPTTTKQRQSSRRRSLSAHRNALEEGCPCTLVARFWAVRVCLASAEVLFALHRVEEALEVLTPTSELARSGASATSMSQMLDLSVNLGDEKIDSTRLELAEPGLEALRCQEFAQNFHSLDQIRECIDPELVVAIAAEFSGSELDVRSRICLLRAKCLMALEHGRDTVTTELKRCVEYDPRCVSAWTLLRDRGVISEWQMTDLLASAFDSDTFGAIRAAEDMGWLRPLQVLQTNGTLDHADRAALAEYGLAQQEHINAESVARQAEDLLCLGQIDEALMLTRSVLCPSTSPISNFVDGTLSDDDESSMLEHQGSFPRRTLSFGDNGGAAAVSWNSSGGNSRSFLPLDISPRLLLAHISALVEACGGVDFSLANARRDRDGSNPPSDRAIGDPYAGEDVLRSVDSYLAFARGHASGANSADPIVANELFALGHALLQAAPGAAIAWYCVGCHYAVMGEFALARQNLLRAAELDAHSMTVIPAPITATYGIPPLAPVLGKTWKQLDRDITHTTFIPAAHHASLATNAYSYSGIAIAAAAFSLGGPSPNVSNSAALDSVGGGVAIGPAAVAANAHAALVGGSVALAEQSFGSIGSSSNALVQSQAIQTSTPSALLAQAYAGQVAGLAWLAIGHCSSSEGELDQAIAAYRTAERLMTAANAPESRPRSHRHLCIVSLARDLTRSKNCSLARRYLQSVDCYIDNERGIAGKCRDPSCWHELGGTLFADPGDARASAFAYFKALQLAASRGQALETVVELTDDVLDRWYGGQSPLPSADLLGDRWEDTMANLGMALRMKGHYALAAECFERCLLMLRGMDRRTMRENRARVHVELGATRMMMAQPERAINCFHAALALAPISSVAQQAGKLLQDASEELVKASMRTGDTGSERYDMFSRVDFTQNLENVLPKLDIDWLMR